jgi:hypothetical protein
MKALQQDIRAVIDALLAWHSEFCRVLEEMREQQLKFWVFLRLCTWSISA